MASSRRAPHRDAAKGDLAQPAGGYRGYQAWIWIRVVRIGLEHVIYMKEISFFN
jgi:hypothetical protein